MRRRELIRAAKTVCKEEDLYSCLKCNARIRNKIVFKKKKTLEESAVPVNCFPISNF